MKVFKQWCKFLSVKFAFALVYSFLFKAARRRQWSKCFKQLSLGFDVLKGGVSWKPSLNWCYQTSKRQWWIMYVLLLSLESTSIRQIIRKHCLFWFSWEVTSETVTCIFQSEPGSQMGKPQNSDRATTHISTLGDGYKWVRLPCAPKLSWL